MKNYRIEDSMVERPVYYPEHHHIAIENRWPEFQQLLFEHGWSGPNIQRVKEGYIIAQGSFIGQPRKSGQDWMFSHGERIAKKLVTEWKYRDPVAVVSALNHDTAEDTVAFEPPKNVALDEMSEKKPQTELPPRLWPTNSEKREFARMRMRKLFDKDTARIVLALTRPTVDHVEVLSDEQVQEMYVRQIAEANDMRVLVIKLEDNINNLEEPFSHTAHERKKKQIKEHYLPIYDKLLVNRYKLEIAERRLLRLNELLETS